MKYRVVRIIEYVYDSPERMILDMENWAVSANGVHRFNSDSIIRSATMPPDLFDAAWDAMWGVSEA